MTDDEIFVLIVEHDATSGEVNDAIAFARAIEQRTLTNQKARWYQEGVEAERRACWKVCDDVVSEYYGSDLQSAAARCAYLISTRGE